MYRARIPCWDVRFLNIAVRLAYRHSVAGARRRGLRSPSSCACSRPHHAEPRHDRGMESRFALEMAGIAGRAHYPSVGFDMPAMMARLGVKAELGQFTAPANLQ